VRAPHPDANDDDIEDADDELEVRTPLMTYMLCIKNLWLTMFVVHSRVSFPEQIRLALARSYLELLQPFPKRHNPRSRDLGYLKDMRQRMLAVTLLEDRNKKKSKLRPNIPNEATIQRIMLVLVVVVTMDPRVLQQLACCKLPHSCHVPRQSGTDTR